MTITQRMGSTFKINTAKPTSEVLTIWIDISTKRYYHQEQWFYFNKTIPSVILNANFYFMSFVVLLASYMFWFYNRVRAINMGLHPVFNIQMCVLSKPFHCKWQKPKSTWLCSSCPALLSWLGSAFWPKISQQSPLSHLATESRHHPPSCP